MLVSWEGACLGLGLVCLKHAAGVRGRSTPAVHTMFAWPEAVTAPPSPPHLPARRWIAAATTGTIYGVRADNASVPEHDARTAVWAMGWSEVGLWA